MSDFEKESIILSDGLEERIKDTVLIDEIVSNNSSRKITFVSRQGDISGDITHFMYDDKIVKIDGVFRKQQFNNIILNIEEAIVSLFNRSRTFKVRNPSISYSVAGEDINISVVFIDAS